MLIVSLLLALALALALPKLELPTTLPKLPNELPAELELELAVSLLLALLKLPNPPPPYSDGALDDAGLTDTDTDTDVSSHGGGGSWYSAPLYGLTSSGKSIRPSRVIHHHFLFGCMNVLASMRMGVRASSMRMRAMLRVSCCTQNGRLRVRMGDEVIWVARMSRYSMTITRGRKKERKDGVCASRRSRSSQDDDAIGKKNRTEQRIEFRSAFNVAIDKDKTGTRHGRAARNGITLAHIKCVYHHVLGLLKGREMSMMNLRRYHSVGAQ